jgi:hypothetical protein
MSAPSSKARRSLRGHEFRLGLIGLLACVAGFLWSQPPAPAAAIPFTVTGTPNAGLSDGVSVHVHAEVGGGLQLFEITAHLCSPGAGISNTYDFGFQGGFCTRLPVGGSDTESAVALQNTSQGDLQFKVGEGSTTWIDEIGYVHTLTCDPDHACDLVVELEVTNNTLFQAIPLSFGGSAPPATTVGAGASDPPANPAPTTTAAPKAAAAAGSGKGSGGASGSGASGSSGGSSGHSTTSSGRGSESPTGSGSSSSSSSSTGDPSTHASTSSALGTPSVNNDTSLTRRAVRVFSAGAAGLIGGVLIALILIRALRRPRVVEVVP